MFNDKRSKKVVFISHCILNQNSISDGTADRTGSITEIVNLLMDNNIGIIQLPCPELICLGLDRGNPNGSKSPILNENTRIRESLISPKNIENLKKLARQVVMQLEEYQKFEFTIIGLIGIDRSPSCGVNTTTINNKEIDGMGLFIIQILEELKTLGITTIDFVGINPAKIEKSILSIKELINNLN